MADIAMNVFQKATDAEYIYAEASDGKQVKVKKGDLIHIAPIIGFNGNFKDPVNFPNAGLYIYNVNTEYSGIINGPVGISVLYGIVEIISRIAGSDNGLNVVTIKVYSRDRTCFMLIGNKNSGSTEYSWGSWKQIY